MVEPTSNAPDLPVASEVVPQRQSGFYRETEGPIPKVNRKRDEIKELQKINLGANSKTGEGKRDSDKS